MERRTFLTTGALGVAPIVLGATPLTRVSQDTGEHAAAQLTARVAGVRSLRASWRIEVMGGTQAADAKVLEGTNSVFYSDGRYRVVYERGPLVFTELCLGPTYVKTVRQLDTRKLLRTEYEGRTPAHKTPAALLHYFLPAPQADLVTHTVDDSATSTAYTQRAGRHRYLVDQTSRLLKAHESADAKGVVRWRRQYDGYVTHLDPAFAMTVLESRYSAEGTAQTVLRWTFDAVAINEPIAEQAFEWRRR